MAKYSQEQVARMVADVPFWGQSIPLPPGIVTPGRVMPNLKIWPRLGLDENLKGKRVLDIGTWDGFYAFEAEKRGAEVVAIDNCMRMQKPNEKQFGVIGNKGFETAKEILGSHVRYVDMSVYDISPAKIGCFDITLCLGLLYHLKHPLLALEKISAITNNMIIIETAWLRTFSRLQIGRASCWERV